MVKAIAVLVTLFLLTGCAVEFRADGTKRVSFNPTVADYKAVREFSSR